MSRSLLVLACLSLLAPASAARAQQEDGETEEEMPLAAQPVEGGDTETEGGGPDAGGSTQPDATGPADGEPATEPEGVVPTEATSSVVVDERQAELEREQRAMEAEAAGEEAEPTEEEESDELSHLYQMGVRAGIGLPFFFGIKYAEGPPCDAEGDTFCFFLGSGFVDLDLSFGVTEDLEITALGQIGVTGTQPTDELRLLFGLGIRSLLVPRGVVKPFLGVRLILDATQEGMLSMLPGAADWGPVDFGVRGEFGIQVDIVRYFSVYGQIAVNILFLRSFGVGPDAVAGLQARFP